MSAGNSLAVQWLGLCTVTVGRLGFDSWEGQKKLLPQIYFFSYDIAWGKKIPPNSVTSELFNVIF